MGHCCRPDTVEIRSKNTGGIGMIDKLSLRDLTLKGKKVLMRVDFNVPQDETLAITDDTRIRAALPSIQHVLEHGGALILMSHLGRPKGSSSEKYSLKPVAERLSELIGRPVNMASDTIGSHAQELICNIKAGDIILLENVRFHRAEEKPDEDPSFAETLAAFGDVYVNDAFGTAHRAHSSTCAIARFFPGASASGFLLEKEIEFLGKTMKTPQKPFYAIIGGAKVSTKLGIIEALLEKVDGLIIGGGMSYTFFKAQGIEIGDSICEDDFLDVAKKIMTKCEERNISLLLPRDLIIADDFSNDANIRVIAAKDGIPEGYQGMSVGPDFITDCREFLQDAKTIMWNGPVGVFEFTSFAEGTFEIAEILAGSKATTIVGGGDSVSAIKKSGLSEKFSHISTGGGASLEYIQYGSLPGIDALSEKKLDAAVSE
jgi:phosphoglycerate kinase